MLKYNEMQKQSWNKMPKSFRWFMIHDEIECTDNLSTEQLLMLKLTIEGELWYRRNKE